MRTPGFDLTVVGAGSLRTVVLSGELDLSAAPSLVSTVAELCRDGAETIELDLRELSFIDSSGIHALVVSQELCDRAGCSFFVVPSQAPQIVRVWEIAELADVLPSSHGAASV
ncbi:MAG: STAS domain-containing protein [Solirubrobacteraceae bacterium]